MPVFLENKITVLFCKFLSSFSAFQETQKQNFYLTQRQPFADVIQNRWKTPVLEPLFNKVAGLKAYRFIKIRRQHKCFLGKLAKFLRTPFLENNSVAASVFGTWKIFVNNLKLLCQWPFHYKQLWASGKIS